MRHWKRILVISLLVGFLFLSGCLSFFLPKVGTVSGLVKSGADPVVGATVAIPALNLSAVTNAQGAYSIDKVPFGTYVLVVYQDDAFLAVKEDVVVEKGKEEVNCDIDLVSVQYVDALEGTVLSATGNPLGETTITLSIGEYSITSESDPMGEFVFFAVPFGTYVVRALRDGTVVYEESITVDGATTLDIVVSSILHLDPNLEAVVREKIGKLVGDLTVEDVAGIEVLEAKEKGITSLVGLQYFTSLRVFRVDSNPGITDLSPLATLTSLREVFVNYCRVVDLSPLAGLPNLFRLEFNSNPVTSLAAFEGHTGLRSIMCHSVGFTSIGELPSLPNLEEWVQGWASLNDLTGIATKFPQLKKLFIGSTDVEDITELLSLEHLQEVTLPSALNTEPEHPVVTQLRAKGVVVNFS